MLLVESCSVGFRWQGREAVAWDIARSVQQDVVTLERLRGPMDRDWYGRYFNKVFYIRPVTWTYCVSATNEELVAWRCHEHWSRKILIIDLQGDYNYRNSRQNIIPLSFKYLVWDRQYGCHVGSWRTSLGSVNVITLTIYPLLKLDCGLERLPGTYSTMTMVIYVPKRPWNCASAYFHREKICISVTIGLSFQSSWY